MNKYKMIFWVCLLLIFLSWGCKSKTKKSQSQEAQTQVEQKADSGLTDFQLKNGIGPIKEAIKLGPIDEKMVATGKGIFEQNCSSCHKIGERYVGPDLKDVTTRRTPAYIMNMILNPHEMAQKQPQAHQLLEKFATEMSNMHLTQKQARAVLEYLRSVNPNAQKE